MRKPYFSVIVPFYNKARTLRACLDALERQDLPASDWELIAVDNNSADGSAAIAGAHPRVRLLREKEQGAYAARNAGIRAAAGEILVFTDADTAVPEHWLSAIRARFAKSGCDLLAGWYAPAAPVWLARQHCALLAGRLQAASLGQDPDLFTACGANLAVRRELFEKEGLFRTDSNSEDAGFALRCMERGYSAVYEAGITVKRNDIRSARAYLLKNFIYGCAGGAEAGREGAPAAKLKYAAFAARFALRHFPAGLAALLPGAVYLAGYVLSKARLLGPKRVDSLVSAAARLLARQEGAAAAAEN